MHSLAAVLRSRPKEVTMEARFRHYRVGANAISLFADDGFAALQGTVSVRSTDQTEEKPNG